MGSVRERERKGRREEGREGGEGGREGGRGEKVEKKAVVDFKIFMALLLTWFYNA